MADAIAATDRMPTRWGAALFRAKVGILRARRSFWELKQGAPPRFAQANGEAHGALAGESRSALYPGVEAAEFALQAGKAQNLRIAARCLDGLAIPAGEVFSFWAHVPRPTRGRGFAAGRELREGCIVSSVGGGLCQLSNALYDVALQAGCEIVERHAHSRRVPGSMAAAGRDATIFWNYVDLRFRPAVDCRLEVRLGRRDLVVRLYALSGTPTPRRIAAVNGSGEHHPLLAAESCETCGVADCFRHADRPRDGAGITAWLVDAWWPEYDAYLRQHRAGGDWLFLPMRGGVRNYRWSEEGYARVRQARLETLWRSWQSRRLAAQGAERQRALLRFDERLAVRYLRGLPAEAMHLVVCQTLLPYLWRAGALGGRTFDVLMTRLPIFTLQAALDRAAARHPGCGTLVDFRAPPQLADAETEALAEARHWITPHSAIARMAGPRAIRLPWHIPLASRRAPAGGDVLFPASTLARKGAYELADAARKLGLRVRLGGPLLEGAQCWQGVETAPAAAGWEGVGMVALPAWVEHQPRRLLEAAGAGMPVIASAACGLEGIPGIATVPDGDVSALTDALRDEQTAVAFSPGARNHFQP